MADQLEGRNPVIECLARRRRKVRRIWLDSRAKADPKVRRLLELAEDRGVPVERVERRKLDEWAEGRVHNGVIARADPLPSLTTLQLLDAVFAAGRAPLVVLADQVQYEHNLGAILRSALGFGVDGLILPTRRGASLSPVVQRVAMGAAEEVPVVREGLFAAMKQLRKAGVPIVGADMAGEPVGGVDLTGACALVLGGEGRGLSRTLRDHCDQLVSIPLQGDLESLNVSVAAAILLYEKRRQDAANPDPSRDPG
jgi:23S rRNA (guanosine2251-2'-O)-methyltransferase